MMIIAAEPVPGTDVKLYAYELFVVEISHKYETCVRLHTLNEHSIRLHISTNKLYETNDTSI